MRRTQSAYGNRRPVHGQCAPENVQQALYACSRHLACGTATEGCWWFVSRDTPNAVLYCCSLPATLLLPDAASHLPLPNAACHPSASRCCITPYSCCYCCHCSATDSTAPALAAVSDPASALAIAAADDDDALAAATADALAIADAAAAALAIAAGGLATAAAALVTAAAGADADAAPGIPRIPDCPPAALR
eukprot:290900-Chlamydomonas_euryale.AAC.1